MVSILCIRMVCNYFILIIWNCRFVKGLLLLYAIVQLGRQLDDSVTFSDLGSRSLEASTFPLLIGDAFVSNPSQFLSLSRLFDDDFFIPLLPLASALAVTARIATYVLSSSKGVNAFFKLLKRAGIMISSWARRSFILSRSWDKRTRINSIKRRDE